ncbi:hypothetical protein LTR78_005313 [Recurvomyces mirabilis]|uniref:Uncharacterized protein n=1 Tax=Recurvomyces mirabilis TaxID=574656 RepID=A0AAE1C1W2_9PEZI|nr:hypothetical protein LTR78_005313 [Recurvomyces mirabilis]KAK5157863.1 hypothetical protein LTS14_003785 [Recurvomyces mirabilis]
MQAAGLVATGANEQSLKVQPEQVLAGLRMMVAWGGEIMGMSGGGMKIGETEHQYRADEAEGFASIDTSHKEKDLVDFDTFDEV